MDMHKKLIFVIILVSCCIGGFVINRARFESINLKTESQNFKELQSLNIADSTQTDVVSVTEPKYYTKKMSVPATDIMPSLFFELTGVCEEDNYYYPKRLVIRANNDVLQEINFDEKDFAPCTLDNFGWEYGDYKFDGYGGFRILSTSLGINPSYYFWIWDKEDYCFVKSPDLEKIVGNITFDYNKKLIYVSSSGGNDYHEFEIYKYIDDELRLIEKAIDTGGYRKVYKVKNNELELIKIIKTPLFD